MNLELLLLTRVIGEQSILKAKQNGLNHTFFRDPRYKRAWNFIVDFANRKVTRNQAPSVEHFLSETGIELEPLESAPPLGEIIGRLNDRRMRQIINVSIEQLRAAVDANNLEAALEQVNRLNKDLNLSTLPTHRQMDLIDAVPSFLQNYETMATKEGMVGIPFPYDILNRAGLGGLAPGCLYMTYAPSKAGKTWFGCLCSVVHPFVNGARVLCVSMELSVDQMWRRILAIFAGLDYGGVVGGNLPLDAKEVMYDALTNIQEEALRKIRSDLKMNQYRDIRVVKPSRDFSGVNFIQGEIEKFQPDIVFIDGLYLMGDDRQRGRRDSGWKTITNITQDVKLLCSDQNIPFFATTQANREGAKKQAHNVGGDDYTDIGGSMSFIQDADVVFRLHKIANANKVLVTLPAVREADVNAFTINFRPCKDFSVDRLDVSKEDIKSIILEDDEDVEESSSNYYSFGNSSTNWK